MWRHLLWHFDTSVSEKDHKMNLHSHKNLKFLLYFSLTTTKRDPNTSVPFVPLSLNLKTEAAGLQNFDNQPTWRHIPEDCDSNIHHRENLKFQW